LSGHYDLVILDEINYVLGYGYIPVDDVVQTLQSRPAQVHVVLTGRNAPEGIVSIADCPSRKGGHQTSARSERN